MTPRQWWLFVDRPKGEGGGDPKMSRRERMMAALAAKRAARADGGNGDCVVVK